MSNASESTDFFDDVSVPGEDLFGDDSSGDDLFGDSEPAEPVVEPDAEPAESTEEPEPAEESSVAEVGAESAEEPEEELAVEEPQPAEQSEEEQPAEPEGLQPTEAEEPEGQQPAEESAEPAESFIPDGGDPFDLAAPSEGEPNERLEEASKRFLNTSKERRELERAREEFEAWCEQRMDEIKARVREAKAKEEEAFEIMTSIMDGRQYQLRLPVGDLFDEFGADNEGEEIESAESSSEAAGDSPSPAQSVTEAPESASTSPGSSDKWRDIPLSKLDLASIPRLGKAKIEAIESMALNLGDLEDIRATPGGFTNVKGIGVELASAIEEYLLNWMQENDVWREPEADESPQEEQASDPKVNETEGDNGDEPAILKMEGATESTEPSPDEVTEESDEDDEDDGYDYTAVLAHLRESGLEFNSKSPYLPADGVSGAIYQEGYKAFMDGTAGAKCPYPPSSAQAQWHYGWLRAEWEEQRGDQTA